MAARTPRHIEREIIICYLAGIPIADIERRYGVSRMAIHRTLKRHQIPTNRGKRLNKES